MKNKYLIISLLIIGLSTHFEIFAQNNTEYQDIVSSLDTSRLSTDFLLIPDSLPFVFNDYNGTNDTLFSNRALWGQSIYLLKSSQLKQNDLLDFYTIDSIVQNCKDNNITPISIVNLNYNIIKEYAISSNLITCQDEHFNDGPNTSETPYYTKKCFMATSLIDTTYSSIINFKISTELLFTNSSQIIDYIHVDFDDGNGIVEVDLNTIYTISYPSTGEKKIRLEVHYVGGSENVCGSSFLICPTDYYAPAPSRSHDLSDDLSGSINGITYYGDYKAWYGCGNETIRKPLIFVEGIDPDDGKNNNDGGLYNLANQQQLLDKLFNYGYDVFLLNFKDGGAKIEGNAMVLRDLIQKIQDVCKNQVVVIGASMGGLVARYTLSYMEKHNEDHNTRMFISLDAPQQGAYIPLSAQHLLSQLKKAESTIKLIGWLCNFSVDKQYKEINKSYRKVECDAAKQMLVYHYSCTNNNKAYRHNDRNNFLSDLFSLTPNGYPQQCRMIAISEGSGTGNNQNPTSSDKYIDLNEETNNYKIRLLMANLPDNTFKDIFKLDIWKVGRWKIGPFKGKYYISIAPFNNVNISVDNTLPYDYSPGGYYNITDDAIIAMNNFLGKANGATIVHNCLIPTRSALDLQLDASNLFYHTRNNLSMGTSFSKEIFDHSTTPFDAIYVENENKEHLTNLDNSITPDMVNFMLDEIATKDICVSKKIISQTNKKFEDSQNLILCSGSSSDYFNIINTSDVVATSSNSILLNPGFSVEVGSTFNASIIENFCSKPIETAVSNSSMVSQAPRLSIDYSTIVESNNNHKNDTIINGYFDYFVFPNPSDGFITFKGLPINVKVLMQIFDTKGKLVYERSIFENNTYFVPLQDGLYYIKLYNNHSNLYNQSLLIKKK